MSAPCPFRALAAQAGRRGAAHALDDGTRIWTYGELVQLAARVAGALDATGDCGRGAPVGLMSGRGILAVAASVAIMATGRVLVPLSPSLPEARRAAILAATGCRATIRAPTDPTPAAQGLSVLTFDPAAPSPAAHFSPSCRPGDLAYLIATSGSTGAPKIVAIAHQSVAACLAAMAPRLALRPDDRVATCADPGFDVAIGELLLTLGAGACLCPPRPRDLLNPRAFVAASGVTVWSSVPTVAANAAALGALGPGDLGGLRLSLFCGEVLGTRLATAWQRAAPRGRIVNAYGPAEATIFATAHVFDPHGDSPDASVPVGLPLAGLACRIEPGSDAGPGELSLAGAQLFAGYLNDPSATAAAMVTHGGRRWYRTGDMVVRRSDGAMIWCGRRDRMVKLRGHRTELAEIERIVADAAGATAAVVLPETGEDGLAASVVAVHNGLGEEAAIRAICGRYLPGPMVPRRVLTLARMPLTINGKLDRRALAARVAEAETICSLRLEGTGR